MWSNSHSTKTIERTNKLGAIDFLVKSDREYKDVVQKAKVALGM